MAGGKKIVILCHMNNNKTPVYKDISSAVSALICVCFYTMSRSRDHIFSMLIIYSFGWVRVGQGPGAVKMKQRPLWGS